LSGFRKDVRILLIEQGNILILIFDKQTPNKYDKSLSKYPYD